MTTVFIAELAPQMYKGGGLLGEEANFAINTVHRIENHRKEQIANPIHTYIDLFWYLNPLEQTLK